jgi:hypothetical protein
MKMTEFQKGVLLGVAVTEVIMLFLIIHFSK